MHSMQDSLEQQNILTTIAAANVEASYRGCYEWFYIAFELKSIGAQLAKAIATQFKV